MTLIAFYFALIEVLKKSSFHLPKSSLAWGALGLLVAVNIFATIFSKSPYFSFWGIYGRGQGAFQLMFYLGFFWTTLLVFSNSKKGLDKLWIYAIAGAAITCLLAILQKFVQINSGFWMDEEFLGRAYATMAHPNFLAAYLLIVFPFLFLMKSRWKYFLALLFLAGLIATGSRSGLIVFIFEIILLAWAFGASLRKHVLSLTLIILLLGISFNAPRFLDRDQALRPIQSRLIIWQSAWEAIEEKPLLGHGLETFQEQFSQKLPKSFYQYEKFGSGADRAHNEFLDIWVTTGLIGLISYIFLLASIFIVAFKKRKDPFIVASLISLSAILINNQFSFSTTVHWIFWWFLLAGILIKSLPVKKVSWRVLPRPASITLIILLSLTAIFLINFSVIRPFRADMKYREALAQTTTQRSFDVLALMQEAINIWPHSNFYEVKAARYALLQDSGNIREIDELFDLRINHFLSHFKEKNSFEYLLAAAIFSHSPESFESLLNIYPNKPEVYLEFAKMLEEDGDFKSALTYYKAYLNLAPEYKNADQMRKFLKHNPSFPNYLEKVNLMEMKLGT